MSEQKSARAEPGSLRCVCEADACVQNPYEKEDSALEILKILKNYPLDGIVQKPFYVSPCVIFPNI